MKKRLWVFAIPMACLLALVVAGTIAWHFTADRASDIGIATSSPALEIRWHGGGIVLQGSVPDEATQRTLAEGAAARLGGESDQVTDWLDITPTALPIADAAALAKLIQLGQEGWHLQRRSAEGWLAVPPLTDERSAQARALLQTAFGPGVAMRLIALP